MGDRKAPTPPPRGARKPPPPPAPPGPSIDRPEVCICAALRLADGRIIRGHRHDGCIHTAIQWKAKPSEAVQGFFTSRERFVTREEGMLLQRAAGRTQPDGRPLLGYILFSEDLY
jgi:hypothetical protein